MTLRLHHLIYSLHPNHSHLFNFPSFLLFLSNILFVVITVQTFSYSITGPSLYYLTLGSKVIIYDREVCYLGESVGSGVVC
jgi:hypothetical protein